MAAQPTSLQKVRSNYGIQYRIQGNVDPSVVATDGVAGTVYLLLVAPFGIFQKQDDGVTTNWANVGVQNVIGTFAAPLVLDGTAPITIPDGRDTTVFIASSGGPVVMPNPPVVFTAGRPGQKVTIIGTSGANTVEFDDTTTAGDFYCNGNRVIGLKQSIIMVNLDNTALSIVSATP